MIGWTAKSGSGARDGRQHVGHDRTETTVELYAPPDWTPAVGDLIDLPDGQCEVIGIEDYRWGFHGWKPGTVVLLQRIEG
ncbi:hypothetical protein [Nocardia rhizosphaerae]|uniref:Head-to-tail stopper n=1 Tax=Nocardia rhizosphaerae TaxID=1691571 RepID=A0ABV8L2I3_9NOCA